MTLYSTSYGIMLQYFIIYIRSCTLRCVFHISSRLAGWLLLLLPLISIPVATTIRNLRLTDFLVSLLLFLIHYLADVFPPNDVCGTREHVDYCS